MINTLVGMRFDLKSGKPIIANGTAAYTLYHTYCEEHTGRTAVKCPSTSPANAVFTLDRLEDAWGKVFLDLYPQLDL